MDYTAIGSVINISSRLEKLNKVYGTLIMISEATKNAAGAKFVTRKLDSVRFRGIDSAINVYELVGRTGEVPEKTVAALRAYEAALELYSAGHFPAAEKAFLKLLDEKQVGKSARTMLERTRVTQRSANTGKWDGVYNAP